MGYRVIDRLVERMVERMVAAYGIKGAQCPDRRGIESKSTYNIIYYCAYRTPIQAYYSLDRTGAVMHRAASFLLW